MNSRAYTGVSRLFSDLFNVQHGNPSFGYLYDASAVIHNPNGTNKTGAWRPAVPTDFAANLSLSGVTLQTSPNQGVFYSGGSTASLPVQVTNTAPIPVSGVVLTQAPNITAVSGVVQVAPPVLQAVSGFVTVTNPGSSSSSFVSGVVGITGAVNVTGTVLTLITNPIVAVSGTTNATIVGTPNVAVTSLPSVTIANPQTFVGITGTPIFTIANPVFSLAYTGSNNLAAPQPVSGVVTIAGGINTSSSTVLTGQNNVIIGYTGGSLIGVSGSISVAPAALQAISGFVTVTNPGASSSSTYITGQSVPINISYTGGALIGVSGALTASISSVAVTGGSLNVAITGGVTVTPAAIQAISGFVTVVNPGSSSSSIVTGGGGFIGVTGNVLTTISNSILAVSGTVISVETGVRAVVLTNPTYQVLLTGANSVSVSNFPTSQNVAITGGVTVTPAVIQAVSGIVKIDSTQPVNVSGSLGLTGLISINNVGITGIVNTLASGTGFTFISNPVVAVSGVVQTTAPAFTNVQYTGGGQPFPVSGNFTLSGTLNTSPMNVTGVVLTSGAQTTFGFNITGFSVGQVQIPAGASAYSIALTSGTGFVGGQLLTTPYSFGGGGYSSNFRLGTAINVGTSGGQFLIVWEI